MRQTAQLLFGIGLAAAVVASCATNNNPHDDDNPTFELVGVHAAIECETCHGDGAFGPLPTDCVSCHEADRPERHYRQRSCGEAGCHTPVGWKATGFGDDDDDDDSVPRTDLGCTCSATGTGGSGGVALLLLGLATILRRRR